MTTNDTLRGRSMQTALLLLSLLLMVALAGESSAATLASPATITVPARDSDGRYAVSWTASPTVTDGIVYLLQEATDSAFTVQKRSVPLTTPTSARITGRKHGVTYYYRVKATRSGWRSSAWTTSPVGCQVRFRVNPPGAITVPAAGYAGGSHVVSWTASTTPEVTYLLQEATDINFSTSRRTVPHGDLLSATVDGRTLGTTYYYRVKAIKSGFVASSWRTGANGCTIEPLTWQRTFAERAVNAGKSVRQTTDDGYVIAGFTGWTGSTTDAYLVKTDAYGEEVWTKTYSSGTDMMERLECVGQSTDNGYILAGKSKYYPSGAASSDSNVLLIKTDGNGEQQWLKIIAVSRFDDSATSVQQTSDGGFVITGGSGNSYDGFNLFLFKTDGNGNETWTRWFGGAGNEYGHAVQQTDDNGFIIAGSTSSSGAGGDDLYLVKTDDAGTEIWSKTFGGTRGDVAYSVQQTDDGGYIAVGSSFSLTAAGEDVFLVKTDGDGNLVWSRKHDRSPDDIGYGVRQTGDGGFIVAGETYTRRSIYDSWHDNAYLLKTDSQGNKLWDRNFGGLTEDSAFSVDLTSDGGFVIAGHSGDLLTYEGNVLLIKTDSEGN